jgi:type II secretory pathway pseudopilin PulG
MFKHGAMFGLDARIALAIFGALSVISGAALYNAIQDAKVTSIQVEFAEARKAWEAYYLDTGSELPIYSSNDDFFSSGHLVEDNSVDGWAGPYLSYPRDIANPERLLMPNGINIIYFNAYDNVSWGGTWNSNTCPTGGDGCYSWIMLHTVRGDSLVKSLDIAYDGVESGSNGNFRYFSVSGNYRIMLKNMKYK